MPEKDPHDKAAHDAEPDDVEPDEAEPGDSTKGCFACQNLDAYWEEKARTDSRLRERIAELQKARRVGWDRESGSDE